MFELYKHQQKTFKGKRAYANYQLKTYRDISRLSWNISKTGNSPLEIAAMFFWKRRNRGNKTFGGAKAYLGVPGSHFSLGHGRKFPEEFGNNTNFVKILVY